MIAPLAAVAITVQSRALRKAAELLGGWRSLADRLDVKVEDLEAWISGKRRTPRDIFLHVVEVILDELPPIEASAEPPDPPPDRNSAAASSSRGFD